MAKIEFTPGEREVVEEEYAAYMNVVTVAARFHGIKLGSVPVQLADDRSGLIVPDPPQENANGQ